MHVEEDCINKRRRGDKQEGKERDNKGKPLRKEVWVCGNYRENESKAKEDRNDAPESVCVFMYCICL